MLKREKQRDFTEKQKKILELLLDKTYMQKDLAEAVKISGAGLFYHINILENEEHLITKETKYQVGTVSLNEISLNPNAIQRVRKILERSFENYTLISGFGKTSELGLSYTIPSMISGLLKDEGYKINRIVVFVTDESDVKKAKDLGKLDRIIEYKYSDYRNTDSKLMRIIEQIVIEEQKNTDLILDLTPLTKLLTIKLLEISNKFQIPSCYLGKSEDGENNLLWIYQPNGK